MTPQSAEERFWEKVHRFSDGCWFWLATGGQGRSGEYGSFWNGERKVLAHRYAYELLVGPIPEGLTLDHLCRNTRCVNPAHLEPVTNKENTLRGFGWAGENARKTHCVNGHPLSGDNLLQEPSRPGERLCRACRAQSNRNRKRRKRRREAATRAD